MPGLVLSAFFNGDGDQASWTATLLATAPNRVTLIWPILPGWDGLRMESTSMVAARAFTTNSRWSSGHARRSPHRLRRRSCWRMLQLA